MQLQQRLANTLLPQRLQYAHVVRDRGVVGSPSVVQLHKMSVMPACEEVSMNLHQVSEPVAHTTNVPLLPVLIVAHQPLLVFQLANIDRRPGQLIAGISDETWQNA